VIFIPALALLTPRLRAAGGGQMVARHGWPATGGLLRLARYW
jgi:hypothetical protein